MAEGPGQDPNVPWPPGALQDGMSVSSVTYSPALLMQLAVGKLSLARGPDRDCCSWTRGHILFPRCGKDSCLPRSLQVSSYDSVLFSQEGGVWVQDKYRHLAVPLEVMPSPLAASVHHPSPFYGLHATVSSLGLLLKRGSNRSWHEPLEVSTFSALLLKFYVGQSTDGPQEPGNRSLMVWQGLVRLTVAT